MKTWRIPRELMERRGIWWDGDRKRYGERLGAVFPHLGKQEILLWDKNSMRWSRFRGAHKDPSQFAWLAQRGWVPRYFSRLLEEVTCIPHPSSPGILRK